jgi:hypothetical protein
LLDFVGYTNKQLRGKGSTEKGKREVEQDSAVCLKAQYPKYRLEKFNVRNTQPELQPKDKFNQNSNQNS